MNKLFSRVLGMLLLFAVAACSMGAPAATATPLSTSTATVTPSPVPTATATLAPTATPDVAATKQAEVVDGLLQTFQKQNILDSTQGGTIKSLPDFKMELADRGNWADLFETGETLPDTFLFRAHMKWDSTSKSPSISGCGVAFGVQDNDDRYLVVLDKDRILFTLKRGYWSYLVGRTSGPAGPKAGTPTEHDFALLVKGQTAYVWVDGQITNYTLSADQVSSGRLGFTVLSGSNSDYGTRCEMSDIVVWTKAPEQVNPAVDFNAVLAKFKEKGYIDTTDGQQTTVPDFVGKYANKGWYYKWWSVDQLKEEYENFVFSAHFKWDSYTSTPDISGCGIGFGLKENGAHYAVFLDRENVVMAKGTETSAVRMGTADGGRFQAIPKPAEANFAAAVWGNNLYVLVNDVFVHYILSSGQDARGKFALSLLSGGNSGYGTRCEMSNIIFWTPQ